MPLHPKARTTLTQLSLPTPIQKFFSSQKWDLDLSHNLNSHRGPFALYPDVKQNALKALYLEVILSVNPPAHHPINLGPTNVLFTVGSMEGIDLILRTFTEPNQDKICILSPTFPAYEHWARIHNISIEKVPLLGNNYDHFSVEDILRINPKLVFICNPNNPTGTRIDEKYIIELCQSFDGLVIVDEAYIEFADSPSLVFKLSQFKNMILLRTLSKAWGLAGIRCGVTLADRSIIEAMRFVQLPFGVTSFTQNHLRKKLLRPNRIKDTWRKIKETRNKVSHILSKAPNVKRILPSHTNFIFPIFENFPAVLASLKAHRIYVLDCSSSVPNALRVTITSEPEMDHLLEALKGKSLTQGIVRRSA